MYSQLNVYSGAVVMSVLEQLALELDAPARPTLPRNVQAGPARLLRRLLAEGLDLAALEAAAALVVALDEGSVA